jgi:hypothetical protein
VFFADPEVCREKCLGKRDCYLESSKAGAPKHEGPCEDPPWGVHNRVADSKDVKIKHQAECRRLTSESFAEAYLLLYSPAENIAGISLSRHGIIKMLSQANIATFRCHKPIPVVLRRYGWFVASHSHVPGIPYLTYHLPCVRHIGNACRAHVFEQS